MTKLILGNISFDYDNATVHEISAVLMCETPKRAEELGEELCNIFSSYLIPDLWKGGVKYECPVELSFKADVHLCKCNGCGTILIDNNPQTDAKTFEVDASEYDELIADNDITDGERSWICPKCKTDGNLTDI